MEQDPRQAACPMELATKKECWGACTLLVTTQAAINWSKSRLTGLPQAYTTASKWTQCWHKAQRSKTAKELASLVNLKSKVEHWTNRQCSYTPLRSNLHHRQLQHLQLNQTSQHQSQSQPSSSMREDSARSLAELCMWVSSRGAWLVVGSTTMKPESLLAQLVQNMQPSLSSETSPNETMKSRRKWFTGRI